ncbi:MAG: hypothetical protein ABIP44_05690 [Pseudoxanthomonas sp.]
MQLRKKIILGVIMLTLVVFTTALYWKQVGSAERAPESASGIQGKSAAGPRLSRLDNSNRSVPLPALDLSVGAMFEQLKARADQGDALASCRLAVELINCTQLKSLAQVGYMENSQSAERDLSESGALVAANSVAAQQIRILESEKRCAGISEGQRKLAGRYLFQAANAGIPEAMIRYAEGQSITTGASMYGLLQDQGFNQWHREAPGLLEKALEHGEPAAVFVLYVANSDDNSLIGGLIVDDPAKAYSYRLLMSRLRGKSDTPASKLSSRKMAEAAQSASRMHAEYFNNRILREPDAFSSMMTPAWTRPEGSAPRRPCE